MFVCVRVFYFSQFNIFAFLLSLSPGRDADPGSPNKPSSPLPTPVREETCNSAISSVVDSGRSLCQLLISTINTKLTVHLVLRPPFVFLSVVRYCSPPHVCLYPQVHSRTDQPEGHALVRRWSGLRAVVRRIFVISGRY